MTVSCEAGLRIEGDWLLTCFDGNFSHVPPQCVPIDLGKNRPENIEKYLMSLAWQK